MVNEAQFRSLKPQKAAPVIAKQQQAPAPAAGEGPPVVALHAFGPRPIEAFNRPTCMHPMLKIRSQETLEWTTITGTPAQ